MQGVFDELVLTDLIPWAVAAVTVAAALGSLRRSRLRMLLIWIWSLLPLLLVASVPVVSRSFDGWPFLILLLIALLLPWATLTILSYNLVRRFREIQAGS
jgi:hypothetical protein